MKTGVIVQARMSSSRLPRKVLRTVRGKPLLLFLLERLEYAELGQHIVIATSSHDSDNPLALFCHQRGIACFRGPLDDVAGRLIQLIDAYRFDAFVRLSGDSPLLDPELVRRALSYFRQDDCDLVTNVFPRTFPKGQSVEVIRAEAFRQAYDAMEKPEEKEHVTPFFYAHPDRFRIHNFTSGSDYSDVSLVVDTPAELESFDAMIARMKKPHWEYGWKETVALLHAVKGEPAYRKRKQWVLQRDRVG